MTDIKTIMSWLEGLSAPDWRLFHSDSEVQNIAKETLDLLKEQEAKIKQLNRFVNGFSLDAMPVIKCKNCKHHGKDTCSAAAGIAVPPPDDWFCADGKRREDDD